MFMINKKKMYLSEMFGDNVDVSSYIQDLNRLRLCGGAK